jgi:NAD(P)H-dependent FMN reductase
MNIEIVSGSPRQESVTFRLSLYLQNLLRERTEHNVNIIDVRQFNLMPMQEQVYTSVGATPEIYKQLAERMFAANAFIIVSPEYNGSYTAAMKNLFDHFPKQSRKPFGIVTASPGMLGGVRAAMQLQQFICALFGVPSPYMLVTPQVDKKFSPEGELLDTNFQKAIDVFVNEYLWLAEHLVGNGTLKKEGV